MRKIEVKIRHLFWAFKKSFEPSQCYSVNYNGVEFCIKPSFTKSNCWNLYHKGLDYPSFERIDGKDLKVNLVSFNRWFNHFKSMYKFQKWSWYNIDCKKPFGSRLSYINSDNIRF